MPFKINETTYSDFPFFEAIAVPAKSLRSNFLWTLAGNLVYAGCQSGMLIGIAKFGSPVIMGQFALGLAISAPVIMFSNMRLRIVQATDARNNYLFSEYLGLRLITALGALIVIAGIALITEYHRETVLVILAVGLSKAIESVSDIFYGLFQQQERLDRVAISMLIKAPLSLIVLCSGLYLTGNIVWGIIGLGVIWLLVLICYDMPNAILILKALRMPVIRKFKYTNKAEFLRPNFSLAKLGQLTILALPLGFAAMVNSLNNNIPLYFIGHFQGEKALGIFAALAYIMVAGVPAVNAMGQPSNPRLAKYFAMGDNTKFRNLLFKLLGFGGLLAGTGILLALIGGRQILTILYLPEYAEHADLFVWLMVAAGISYIASFLNDGMMAVRYFKIQLPLYALILCVTIVLSFWLIPIYGLYGAAMTFICVRAIHAAFGSTIVGYAIRTASKNTIT